MTAIVHTKCIALHTDPMDSADPRAMPAGSLSLWARFRSLVIEKSIIGFTLALFPQYSYHQLSTAQDIQIRWLVLQARHMRRKVGFILKRNGKTLIRSVIARNDPLSLALLIVCIPNKAEIQRLSGAVQPTMWRSVAALLSVKKLVWLMDVANNATCAALWEGATLHQRGRLQKLGYGRSWSE